MQKIKDRILNFDFGVNSRDKLIVFALFLCYFCIGYVVSGTTRLLWIHWISAYIIGLLVFFFSYKHLKNKSLKAAWRFLFPKDIWTHPSTINDCIIAVINSFFARITYVVLNFMPLLLAGFGGFHLAEYFSLEQNYDIPPLSAILLFTVSIVLASDFCYYWAHRWAHKTPIWWEFHKVHHSAEVMTPLTLLRYHPIDDFIYSAFRRFGQIMASGFFLYLYPTMPGAITVMSSNAIVLTFEFFGSNLRHTHIWLSYGPRIERLLISPAMHHIHHSDNPKHFDKNFGAIFSIWDWMFGTLYIPQGKEDITFGIGKNKQTEQFDTVPKLYIGPFMRSYDLIKKACRKASAPRAATAVVSEKKKVRPEE